MKNGLFITMWSEKGPGENKFDIVNHYKIHFKSQFVAVYLVELELYYKFLLQNQALNSLFAIGSTKRQEVMKSIKS